MPSVDEDPNEATEASKLEAIRADFGDIAGLMVGADRIYIRS